MKKFRLLLLVVLCVAWGSLHAQKAPNFPLPQHPDTLRILGIGNSFTDDGMMYLPELLEAAGIRHVVLGRLYIGGCSLERHCREYATNSTAYIYTKSTKNHWERVSKEASLLDGLTDERWNVVVLQQASGDSGIYQTYQPWLDQLIETVRLHCPNAGACIVWQQTWAYSRNSTHGHFCRYRNDQELMYHTIMDATRQVMHDTSIETIIPSGTTIQNLRATPLCDSLELTRDGYHLSKRMGRYAAACAWFQSLIAPSLGTTVVGNSCRLEGTPHELTAEEAAACQQAALKATIRRFSVWTDTAAE